MSTAFHGQTITPTYGIMAGCGTGILFGLLISLIKLSFRKFAAITGRAK